MTDQQERKFMLTMERLAKAVERVADALEAPGEPMIAELGSFAAPAILSWQDAVYVLRDTCKEAPECGPECPMYEWCEASIPDNYPPYNWKDPHGAGA